MGLIHVSKEEKTLIDSFKLSLDINQFKQVNSVDGKVCVKHTVNFGETLTYWVENQLGNTLMIVNNELIYGDLTPEGESYISRSFMLRSLDARLFAS